MRISRVLVMLAAMFLVAGYATADSFTRIGRSSNRTAAQNIRSMRNGNTSGTAQQPVSVKSRAAFTQTSPDEVKYRPPNEFWDESKENSEQNLRDIYNKIYGTELQSGKELEDLRVGWETFTAGPLVRSISFQAIWHDAHMRQHFGIYTHNPEGNPEAYNRLLSYGDMLDNGAIGPSGDLRRKGITETLDDPSGTFGFYLQSEYFDDGKWKDPAWGPMHSEALQNYYFYPEYDENNRDYETWPNMINEVHFLILKTPNPNVYLLAIEDLPYGHKNSHWDYNDFLVEMRINVIPEPATVTLLGVGLIGLVGVRTWKSRRRSV